MRDASNLDRLVQEFEQEWSSEVAPSLHAYVARLGTSDPQQQIWLLTELICVDLELRWKGSRNHPSLAKYVEDYLAEFSHLATSDEVLRLLVQEEYRARQRWGDSPNMDSYLLRFSGRFEGLRVALQAIDEELRAEYSPEPGADVQVGIRSNKCRPIEEDSIGVRLNHRDYVLHRMIGAGQTGRVYQATYTATNQQLAVKFLRKQFYRDRSAVSRFLHEAQIVTGLAHERIVRVHGVGSTPGGGYFIAMELLDGPDLADIAAQGPVPPPEAIRWLLQAADAVGYMHTAGVIHCDLKPGNLVLDSRRKVRVTDFGLARTVEESSRSVARIAGTAPYMAPEQISGWWGKIGPATDIYALGAVLYHLLTGDAPYRGTTFADILAQVVSGVQPTAPHLARPGVGPDLAAVVMKSLAKSPEHRHQSACEFAAALKSVCDPCQVLGARA